jgi:hypothetical protein
MQSEDTALIPLRARDGSVRAYAVVDKPDETWVNQWHWSLDADGYVQRNHLVDGRQRSVKLHRRLLGLTHGDGVVGDHRDRDKLNNRRSNLRAITKAGNRQNVSSNRVASSKHRGVTWDAQTQKWAAQVNFTENGRRRHVRAGLFDSEEDAARAAQALRVKHLPYSLD